MKLRVVTWNIHKGVTGLAGRLRIHAVQQGLHSLAADVVCLQEVQDHNLRLQNARWRGKHHPGGRQVEFLAQGEYPYHAYGMNALYDHGHHGNAVLSRLPLQWWENLDISDHRFEERGLLHTVLRLPEGCAARELHVLCVHLGLFAGGRRRQAEAMVERVQQVVPADAPLLIAGDFNDWRGHLHTPLTRRLNVQEAFMMQPNAARPSSGQGWQSWMGRLSSTLQQLRGGAHQASEPDCGQAARTFPSRFPTLQLDRLYVRGCQVERAWVPQEAAWRTRSDHAPLCAELIFP